MNTTKRHPQTKKKSQKYNIIQMHLYCYTFVISQRLSMYNKCIISAIICELILTHKDSEPIVYFAVHFAYYMFDRFGQLN